MKQLFPFIANNSNKHKKKMNKMKKLKLNSNSNGKRLKTFNNINSYKSLKTEILQNFAKHKPNTTTFKNNGFMSSIENFSKTSKDHITINEYNKISNDLMERYTYYNPKAETEEDIIDYENEMTKTKADYFLKKKKVIQLSLDKSKKLMQTSNDFKTQKAIIKFNATEFKNPIDSLGLILKNKTIHDKVLNNYQNREMQCFGNNIRKINKIKGILSLSKNVKISTILPRNFEDFENEMDLKTYRNSIAPNVPSIIGNLRKSNPNLTLSQENNKQSNTNITNINLLSQNQSRISTLTQDVLQKGSIYLLPGYHQSTKIFPECREEFSLNHDLSSNTLYLFSGNTSHIDSPLLWKFNLSNFIWEPLKPVSNVIEKRCGHTGVIYKSKLIIFGGRYLDNTALADVDIYNIEQNYWEMNNYNTIIYLKLRRNHVACLVGQQMFVHGGIDEYGDYLDDSYLLSLGNTYRWSKALISNYGKRSRFPKLAFHSCCLVVPYEIQKHPRFNIHKIPEIPIGLTNTRIREKGIYIFGGKKSELKDPCNKMWVLKIGKKYLEWMEIISKGKPPCPRYLFSMNFYEQGNYIIIHGGKTKSLRSEQILKDTYLFELLRFEWIRVLHGCFDYIVKPRFSHAAIIHNRRLIIFGGVNEQGFSGSNFFLIKLEPESKNEIFLKQRSSVTKRYLLTMKTIRETKDNKEGNDKDDEKDEKDENNKNNKSHHNINRSLSKSRKKAKLNLKNVE